MSVIKTCPKCGLCAPIEATTCSACETKLENLSLLRDIPMDSDLLQDPETRIAREAMEYRELMKGKITCVKCGLVLCNKGEPIPDCPNCGMMERRG